MVLFASLNASLSLCLKLEMAGLEENYAFCRYFITDHFTNSPTTSNSLSGLFSAKQTNENFFGLIFNTYSSFTLFSIPYFNSLARTYRTMV